MSLAPDLVARWEAAGWRLHLAPELPEHLPALALPAARDVLVRDVDDASTDAHLRLVADRLGID